MDKCSGILRFGPMVGQDVGTQGGRSPRYNFNLGGDNFEGKMVWNFAVVAMGLFG